jgi:hypothetical protein
MSGTGPFPSEWSLLNLSMAPFEMCYFFRRAGCVVLVCPFTTRRHAKPWPQGRGFCRWCWPLLTSSRHGWSLLNGSGPQCLAQVATPTLLRGPPQLVASLSFLFLDSHLNRPLHGSPNNQSPSAAQPSRGTPPNLPKSVT